MGLFSRNTAKWQDQQLLAGRPAAMYAGYYFDHFPFMTKSGPQATPKYENRTIQQRLAHMLFRSVQPTYGTTKVAKWYLRELATLPLSRADQQLMHDFRTRLQAAVRNFESQYGGVDVSEVTRLLEAGGYKNEFLLYGPSPSTDYIPDNSYPDGRLYWFIEANGWKYNP